MKRIEDWRRRLEKSPAIPVSGFPPFKVTAPTTLSKAFERPLTSNVTSSAQVDRNITISISPEKNLVDLNVPLSLLVEVDQSSSSLPETWQHIPTLDQAIEKELKNGSTLDPKKLRRTISNRLSAQRSRMKKAQHVVDMEQKIRELQELIAILNPQIENYKNKQRALLIQKATLEQQLHNCMTKTTLCSIEIEENKCEVERLRELQKMLKEQKMMISSNFQRQQLPNINNVHEPDHHPPHRPSSSFRHHFKQTNYATNADSAMLDQSINFDALN